VTQLTDKIWAVEVPFDAINIVLHNYSDWPSKIVFTSKSQDPALCGGDMIPLLLGYWRYICTSKEATNEQLINIVESIEVGQRRLYINYQSGVYGFVSPLSSLRSLFATKLLSWSKNYCLIEKQN